MARNEPSLAEQVAKASLSIMAVAGIAWLVSPSPRKASQKQRPTNLEVDALVQHAYRTAAACFAAAVPPLIQASWVPNAQSDGYTVRYNREWFRSLMQRYCNHHQCRAVIAVGIMAHELAHHYHADAFNLFPRDSRSQHQMELRADHAAGQALAHLALPLDDFERVLWEIARLPSFTHPVAPVRIQALRSGYWARQAQQQLAA